jgi:predicted ATPase
MRLTVTGPQNTGKTTFIKDFLNAFPNYITPKETYRDVVRKNKLKLNRITTENSQRIIRDFLYKQIVENKQKNIIFDRCLLDNLIYSEYQYEIGNFKKDFIDKTRKMVYDSLKHLDGLIFIPTSVGITLTEDGERDINKEYIDAVNRLFISEILEVARKTKIKIFTITGNRETRIKHIGNLIK